MIKIIWIDLDEVLSESIDKVLENNNYKFWNDILSRDSIVNYNLDLIYKDYPYNLFHNTYLNDKNLEIELVNWAKEKVEEFKSKWYILKIVTWRPEDIEEYTINWLNKHFPSSFDSIHFANHFSYWDKVKVKRLKSEICRELWINIMIEDNFDYALELAENWIYTFLLKKPWNKHIEIEHPNIKKIKHWWEINI